MQGRCAAVCCCTRAQNPQPLPRAPPAVPSSTQADPRYASAVAKGSELLAAVQGLPAYKAAASRLNPYLAPAVESIAPYVNKAAAHMAPAAA